MKILEKHCRLTVLQYIIGTVVKINVRTAANEGNARNCMTEGLLRYGRRYDLLESYGENSRKEL